MNILIRLLWKSTTHCIASQTELWHYYCGLIDKVVAEEEAAKAKQDGVEAYTQADVVVALAGWDENSAQPASEGSLRALKYLLEAD